MLWFFGLTVIFRRGFLGYCFYCLGLLGSLALGAAFLAIDIATLGFSAALTLGAAFLAMALTALGLTLIWRQDWRQTQLWIF